MASNRFAESVRPEIILKRGSKWSLKKHFRNCPRQYIGYADMLAANDPERFVWASERDFVVHCKKYPSGKPYGKRMVRRSKKFFREFGIISEQTRRVRGGIVREGFIVAAHDSLVQMRGNVHVLTAMSSPESSPQSSLASSPPSSLWSSLASSPQSGFEFPSEFPREFPSESLQEPQNVDTYEDGKKVCREFAESLATPNPEALKKYEPSNHPTQQAETVRNADLVGWLANEYSKTPAASGKSMDALGSKEILALAAKVGEGTVKESWKHFLRHHQNLQTLLYPFRVFSKEFESIRVQVQQAKQRKAAHVTNKERERESSEKEQEWRRSIWAALECVRSLPEWESKIDDWLITHPAPTLLIADGEKIHQIEYAAELVEDVKRMGQRYVEDAWAEQTRGMF